MYNVPVNSGHETWQCSTSCRATTGTNKHLRARKWKLMGPVSDRPFSQPARQSCSKLVLTSPLALIRLDVRSSISWPVNNRSILKVCLMRLIQHDRTRYTQPEHQSHYQTLSGQQPPLPTIPPPDLFCPYVAVIRFGNEPLIGNCVELHPRRAQQDPIPVPVTHCTLLDGASTLAWNERRRFDGRGRYSATWRLSLRFSKSTHAKKLDAFEMRL